jgi:phage terminase large subunit-like protein
MLGAGLALYGLVGEGEQGAEVYSCAGDREQARIVFGYAKRMVELSPALARVIKPYRDTLEVPRTGSVYRVLSAEAYSKEGLAPSLVLFDEVHVQPDEDLWNVMTLGSGTRRQPMVVGITTAGFDRQTLCGRLYDYGKQVATGEVDDPSFFFHWLEPADPDCDYRDEKVWREVNPALRSGFLSIEDFRTAVRRTNEAAFRRYKLNQWTSAAEAWLPYGAWDACFSPTRIEPRSDVILGFDGSWDGDSTALVACTLSGHLQVVQAWERPAGGTADWRVPIADVEDAIRAACKGWRVIEVAADPYRWQRSIDQLLSEGIPMVEWPTNSVPRMVPATQKFTEAVLDGRLTHDGDPRLARHVENCVVKRDRYGPRITKESKMSARKIDLAVAAVVAYDRATQVRPPARRPIFVV